jgi:hypothetical protein
LEKIIFKSSSWGNSKRENLERIYSGREKYLGKE